MILLYGTQKEECENARRFQNGGHFQRGLWLLGSA